MKKVLFKIFGEKTKSKKAVFLKLGKDHLGQPCVVTVDASGNDLWTILSFCPDGTIVLHGCISDPLLNVCPKGKFKIS